MFHFCNNDVLMLKRIQIGNLKLDNLEVGKWKKMTEIEVDKTKVPINSPEIVGRCSVTE